MPSYKNSAPVQSQFHQVSRSIPCVACGKTDWCVYAEAYDGRGTVFRCMRVSSDQPCKGGGWLHTASTTANPAAARKIEEAPKLSPAELVLINRQCQADLTAARLASLADRLTVSAASLRRLGIGWHSERHAFTFPMRDANCRITGLRIRHVGGSKKCLTGSRLGLMVPAGLLLPDARRDPPDDLLITEGESDAAAVLDMGLPAIARPGCESCQALIVEYVGRLRPGRVVLVADADGPGQRGADGLARSLVRSGIPCRIFTTPDGAKDLRAWKSLSDSNCHALLALIESPADRTEVLP